MRGLLIWMLAAACGGEEALSPDAPDGPATGGTPDGAPGSPPFEVLARDQPGPIGIAVDETYVYWNNIGDAGWGSGEGSVWKVAKNGGIPELLADRQAPFDLAVRGDFVYWARGASNAIAGGPAIVRVPKTGGELVIVAEGLAATQSLAVDDTHIYFQNWQAASGSLDRMTLAGAELTQLDPGTENGPMDILISDSRVLYTNGNSGEVKVYDKISGEVTRITFGFLGADHLLVDETGRAYFTAGYDELNAAVFTVEGRETDYRTVARLRGFSAGLAGAGTRLYSSEEGAIVRIDPASGDVVPLVAPEQSAYALADDADYVYWADYSARTINRVHK